MLPIYHLEYSYGHVEENIMGVYIKMQPRFYMDNYPSLTLKHSRDSVELSIPVIISAASLNEMGER